MITHSTRDGSALTARARLEHDRKRAINPFIEEYEQPFQKPPIPAEPTTGESGRGKSGDAWQVSIITSMATSVKGWVLVYVENKPERNLYIGYMVRPNDMRKPMEAINAGRAARIMVDPKTGNVQVMWPEHGRKWLGFLSRA